jgi:hypothetical protein
MKLSEAIMLGAATCKMESANINYCAYGAALNAAGIAQCNLQDNWGIRYIAAVDLWPWIAANDPKRRVQQNLVPFNDLGNSIWQKFDYEVCGDKMTLEQLVDYVRSIEPNCGDCNRFECTCTAIIHSEVEQHAEVASTTESA